MSNWKPKVFCGLILEWLCFAVVIIGILGSTAIGLIKLPYIRVISAAGVLAGCVLSIVLNEIHDDEAWKFELGTIQFVLKVILGILALAWLASLIKIEDPNQFAATLRGYCNHLFNWRWPIIEIVFVVDRLLHIISRMAGTNDFLVVAYRKLYVVLFIAAIIAVALVVYKFPKHDKNTVDKKKNETLLKNDDNSGEKKNAFEEMIVAAEKGDVGAQCELGLMYYEGKTVEQSYTNAMEWFKKAANQGNAKAEYYLGRMYSEGNGVQQDYNQAIEWFQKAADNNNPEALSSLGEAYLLGNGVIQNSDKAFELFSKSASAGYHGGESWLGYCYEYGNGTEINYAKAIEWYTKAAAQGNNWSECRLSYLYFYGIGTEQNRAKAMEWLPKAAAKGFDEEQELLGRCYYYGDGVEQDYDKAFIWFSKAAEQGNALGQFWVGLMYQYGESVSVDYEKAMEWFLKASDQGISAAKFSIGVMYYYGQGVTVDYKTAAAWFLSAAENGSTAGMYYLGEIYQNGYLGAVELEKAKKWYQKAADGGQKDAQETLKAYSVDTSLDTININQYANGFYKGVVNKDGTALRARPGTKDANGQKIEPMLTEDGQIVALNKGTNVLIYGERKDSDADLWFHIVCSFGGKVYSGYVYAGRVTREGSVIAE